MGRRGNLLKFSREAGLEAAFSGGRGCPWAKKAGRRERRALGPLLSSLFNSRRGAERPLHPGSDRLRGRAQRAVASVDAVKLPGGSNPLKKIRVRFHGGGAPKRG